MPEEQKPFVHEDGSATPAAGRTPAAKLLDPSALNIQVRELEREKAMRERLYPGWVQNGRLKEGVADEQLRILGRAIETIHLLREPGINTVVVAMKSLDPTMQALIADIAQALAVPSLGRQNLANDLRSRLRGEP